LRKDYRSLYSKLTSVCRSGNTVRIIPKYHTVRIIPKYHTVRIIPKYHTVRIIPKSYIKNIERGKIVPPSGFYFEFGRHLIKFFRTI
jgi:hypothetical protein